MKRAYRSGFTLVELLVVIGIIALLISILLPSLNSARRQATAVKCLSNLRSIGQAAMMYGNDNKGVILPGIVWGATNGTTAPDGRDYWPVLLVAGKYLPNPNIGSPTAPVANNTVLICPAVKDNMITRDKFPDGTPQITTAMGGGTLTYVDGFERMFSQVLLTSTTKPLPNNANNGALGAMIYDLGYGINCPSDKGSYQPSADGKLNPGKMPSQSINGQGGTRTLYPPGRYANFKRAAQTVFIFDGTNVNPQNPTNTGHLWRISGMRHGIKPKSPGPNNDNYFAVGTTNILFLDGHVEGVSRGDLPMSAAATGINQIIGDGTMAMNTKYLWNSMQ